MLGGEHRIRSDAAQGLVGWDSFGCHTPLQAIEQSL
jgi:hypothetical protein